MTNKMRKNSQLIIEEIKKEVEENENWSETLTDSEKYIIENVLIGKDISEIAEELKIHYTTVYNTIFGTKRKKPIIERIKQGPEITLARYDDLKKAIEADVNWKAYLTPREIEITELYVNDKLTVDQIANTLGIEYVTVYITLFGSGKSKKGVIEKIQEKHVSNKKHTLINLIDETSEWEQYVTDEQKELIQKLLEGKTITAIADETGLSRTWVNARLFGIEKKGIIGAIQQIEAKELKEGNKNIKRLEQAVEVKPNYKSILTKGEALIIKRLVEEKRTLKEISEDLGISISKLYQQIYGAKDDDRTSILYKIENVSS